MFEGFEFVVFIGPSWTSAANASCSRVVAICLSGLCQIGFEEIMMIINHVTEGMISDHVIGGQKIIRFVIRFDYAYLGKVLSASVMDRWAS